MLHSNAAKYKQEGQNGPGSLTWFFEIALANFFLVAFREEFTRISLSLYSARSLHSLIPCLLTDQNFKNNSEKGHSTQLQIFFKIGAPGWPMKQVLLNIKYIGWHRFTSVWKSFECNSRQTRSCKWDRYQFREINQSMQQIKSIICRQACVACSSEVLMKSNEMSVYNFLLEAIFQCISRPGGTNKHPGFQSIWSFWLYRDSYLSQAIVDSNKNITPTTYFHFWKVRNVFGDA